MKNKFSVILDVDTGIDDAAAIIMACNQKNIDVKLITCCFGNSEQSQVVRNTLTVLEDMKKEHIPVASGATVPVFSELEFIRAHGINGLGGYKKELHTQAIPTPCAKAIHEIVNKEFAYIIACGPYTNIADYIKAYPNDIGKFKLIAVTGSNQADNNEPYLNFNISIDVESFKYVLANVPNIIFCTSDMGHKAYIPTQDFLKSAKCSETGRFLATIYPSHKDRSVKDGAALHDACGVAWLAKPNMFKISFAYAEIKVAKNGKQYLHFDYTSHHPNAIVTTNINKKAFHNWYYKTLKAIKLK